AGVRPRQRSARHPRTRGPAGRPRPHRSGRGRVADAGGTAVALIYAGRMAVTVLLVDDEPLVRAGLRAVLEAQPDIAVAVEAADGAAVIPLVRQLRPDVVAMDVRMPLMHGIEATRALLRTVDAPPKILVVTTFENDEYVYDALRAG